MHTEQHCYLKPTYICVHNYNDMFTVIPLLKVTEKLMATACSQKERT